MIKKLIIGKSCCNDSVYVCFLFKASATVAIPKEHHRFVIGKNGEKLQELELKTATKIQIPRPDDPSNQIKISGTKEGLEKAKHEILLISAEQVSFHLAVVASWTRLGATRLSRHSCLGNFRTSVLWRG